MKHLLIIGATLMGVGLVLFVVVLAFASFDISKISTSYVYEKNNFSTIENGKNLVIDEEVGDIRIGVSQDENINVTYFEDSFQSYTFVDTDSELIITKNYKNKPWYINVIKFDFIKSENYLQVLLPAGFSGNININSSVCSIDMNNITANNLGIEVTNGDLNAENINVKNITAKFVNTNFDVENINVQTFYLKTTNGSIDIEEITANNLEIKTVNGIINAEIEGAMEEYSIVTNVTMGLNNLPNNTNETTDKTISIEATNGEIDVEFTKD